LNVVKVISTSISQLRRLIKFYRLGNSDVRENYEIGPYGVDSNPVKDMVAIYAETAVKGKAVIIGYVNKNQMADVGELRLYSTDADGVEQFFVWFKNNGTLEVGGNSDNMVRYSELKLAFDELKTDLNNLVTAYNAHQHPTAAPGPPSPPTVTGSPSGADISGAKIDEVKTF